MGWLNHRTDLNSGNVDGESLQFGLGRLMRQRADGHLMIVLSDGQPVGADGAEAHLAHVVKEAEKAGVKMVGIGINSQAVRDYYTNYTVLSDPKDLGKTVIGEIRDAILKQ